jgi:uncharacterized membrane protein
MKGIFIKGTLIVFSVGIITFVIYFILDFITRLWKPAIEPMIEEEHLITVVAVVYTILLILIVGFIFTRENLFGRWGRFLGGIPLLNMFMGEKRMPQTVQDMPGALVKFAEGSYYIAALVGEQKFENRKGEIERMYKLYCPSAPVPWSGLPLIFARAEQVILLKLSFADIYAITTSFGRTTPELLQELELESPAE